MKNLQLAISDFAVPSPRVGHIQAYSGYGGLPQVGSQIHAQIQAQRQTEHAGLYIPERWVSHAFDQGTHRVTVSGRMDGFLPGAPAWIEEIKTAYQPHELRRALEEQADHPYKLQLRTYGYLHWLETGQEPALNLHIVDARSLKGTDLALELDRLDYEGWLKRRLEEIVEEQKTFEALAKRRRKSSTQFVFPFPEARPGQRELMETIQTELAQGKHLLLQAPTGLGKTAGVLFPTLQRAMNAGQKVIYVTAKNTQHEVAEDAVRRLQEVGVKVRSVTLHAKTKMCMKSEPHCDPSRCEFARDHYTKVAQNRLGEQLAKKKRLTANSFRKMAERYEVCPFELQMEAVSRADVVICDYNYVFSPRNSLGRLTFNGFGKSRHQPSLVVDEIHNLPDRAASYFSALLSCDDISRHLQRFPPAMAWLGQNVLDALKRLLAEVGHPEQNAPHQIHLQPDQLKSLQAASQELQASYLESNFELQSQDPVLKISQAIAEFAQILEGMGEESFVTLTPSREGGILRITCCDAAKFLTETYGQFEGVVGFSATVKPFDYYSKLLGFPKEDLTCAEFDSPFPRHHRKILLIPQISTKWRDREANLGKIKATIERLVALKAGNYFVFFPSFDFMNRVAAQVNAEGFRLLLQEREMKRTQVQGYLEKLKDGQPTLIFAVQGGVFSEGVDYPGDMLIGALIVGPALPNFDFERELLKQYFDRKHGTEQAFDYAYTYPAMARVVQSAGRVIRSSQDRGLIVLMDRRFTLNSYQKSMPKDWIDGEPSLVSTQILTDVRRFWEEMDESVPST